MLYGFLVKVSKMYKQDALLESGIILHIKKKRITQPINIVMFSKYFIDMKQKLCCIIYPRK
jgi:hypothetical protein